MNSEERRRNLAFGDFAENLAMEYYVSKNYAILERKWHHGKSEIDLIVQTENIIVIVEVKARKENTIDPVLAVSKDKQKRMARAAHSYIRKLKGEYEYRFDIFALTGNENNYSVEVLEDAFLAPLTL